MAPIDETFPEWLASGIAGEQALVDTLSAMWPNAEVPGLVRYFHATDLVNTALEVMGRKRKAWSEKTKVGRHAYGEKLGEAEVVGRIQGMAAEGYCATVIARRLNSAGVAARGGGEWHHGVVARILRRMVAQKDRVVVEEVANGDVD